MGNIAFLQRCDGHLITWLTEVISHLHPTGVSARPQPLLPPCAPTTSWGRFMHMLLLTMQVSSKVLISLLFSASLSLEKVSYQMVYVFSILFI